MKKILLIWIVMLVAISGCANTQESGKNPVETMLDDSTITTRVNHAMMKDKTVKARQIDVDTIGSHVTLTGAVATRNEAKRASQIALSVPGVKSVSNNIQIGKRGFGDIWDDNVLSNKIKAKLIAEPEVRSLNIDVDVYLGVVTLTGVVSSKYQRDRAIDLSRSTDGIVKVIDNIKVR
ncbi:MAG: BON domain-containing protein [Deltaproteobacteria bacterium]|nr:BON domain-containing protein [Deltaproteobacteria bacterium]